MAFTELVRLGPVALPLLLKHLDDTTPTKLTLLLSGNGRLNFGRASCTFEADPRDLAVLKPLSDTDVEEAMFGVPSGLKSYQVKVGDICLVAVSQIIGRRFRFLSGPSGVIVPPLDVVTSPVQDRALAQQVRAAWSSPTQSRMLFNSLLADFATRLIGPDIEGIGMWRATQAQCSAAMRLLYYFPKQSVSVIVERLNYLDVTGHHPADGARYSDAEPRAFEKTLLANGVGAYEFITAVGWCKEPSVQRALRRIYLRTTDPDIKEAVSSALNIK
jgi:hypothetical protein